MELSDGSGVDKSHQGQHMTPKSPSLDFVDAVRVELRFEEAETKFEVSDRHWFCHDLSRDLSADEFVNSTTSREQFRLDDITLASHNQYHFVAVAAHIETARSLTRVMS
jgi:hypothetical protein